jgi:hypothetical protein
MQISPEARRRTKMTATAFTERRELAHRTSDGIDVALFWSKATNRVTLAVVDSHTDERLEFEVDGTDALDAFHHPYAYAATRRPRTDGSPLVQESTC